METNYSFQSEIRKLNSCWAGLQPNIGTVKGLNFVTDKTMHKIIKR